MVDNKSSLLNADEHKTWIAGIVSFQVHTDRLSRSEQIYMFVHANLPENCSPGRQAASQQTECIWGCSKDIRSEWEHEAGSGRLTVHGLTQVEDLCVLKSRSMDSLVWCMLKHLCFCALRFSLRKGATVVIETDSTDFVMSKTSKS